MDIVTYLVSHHGYELETYASSGIFSFRLTQPVTKYSFTGHGDSLENATTSLKKDVGSSHARAILNIR